MCRLLLFLGFAVFFLVITAPVVHAQNHTAKNLRQRVDRVLQENDRYPRGVLRDREEAYRRDRAYEDYRYKDEGSGPAFCRSGAGHPVHGRQWCIDKGFGLGRDDYYYRNDRRTLGDIIFGDPRDDRRDDRRDDDIYRRYPDDREARTRDRDTRNDRTQRDRPSTRGNGQ